MKKLLTLTWWLSNGYRGKLAVTMFSIVFGMVLTIGLLTLSATVHSELVEEIGTAEDHLFLRRKSVHIGGFDVSSGISSLTGKRRKISTFPKINWMR